MAQYDNFELQAAFAGWEGFGSESNAAIESAQDALNQSNDDQKPFPEADDRIPGLLGDKGAFTGLHGARLTAAIFHAVRSEGQQR